MKNIHYHDWRETVATNGDISGGEDVSYYLRPYRAPSDGPLVDGSDGQSGPLYLHHSPPRRNGPLQEENAALQTKTRELRTSC